MRWLDKAHMKLRSLFRRARVEGELDDELQFYLDASIAKHLAAGLSPDDAAPRRATLAREHDAGKGGMP